MSDEGASEELIADLVGHVKTSTTRTVYRHQLRPVITKGADLLDEVFGKLDRSVKRVISKARESGIVLRTRAI
jgi:hypothetical protein